MTLAVVFALAAALSNAVNLMTQHAASIGAPQREKGWRLAVYLARQPLWLLGGAAAVASFVFQALALHNGPMSVVQPVLITELVFVLVLRRLWIHQDVARAAWAAVTVVCVALSVPLTGLLFCTDHAAGGELVIGHDATAAGIAAVERDCSVVKPRAGHLIFFDARQHPHYARPLAAASDMRVVAVMNFYTESFPETTRPGGLNRHLFGRD